MCSVDRIFLLNGREVVSVFRFQSFAMVLGSWARQMQHAPALFPAAGWLQIKPFLSAVFVSSPASLAICGLAGQ
jgi:hypothetical protein